MEKTVSFACVSVFVSCAALARADFGPIGVAQIDGIEVEYRCTPVPTGAQRFYVEGRFPNSGIVRAPDLPARSIPVKGLEAVSAGISNGSGSGKPIGTFTFHAEWSGYRPRLTVIARQDVFRTEAGDLHADELFTGKRSADTNLVTFEGAFTFTGGTGRFRNATGSATAAAQQLGEGRAALVACGWIDGIGGGQGQD